LNARVPLFASTVALALLAVFAFVTASPASADAGDLTITVPADGGVVLAQWGGGPVGQIGDDALADGCRPTSVWTTEDGQLVGHIYGAPPFVNGVFLQRFPNGDVPARALLLLCERRTEATNRLGVLASEVSDAIRDRDQDRLRDYSGDQLRLRTQDQDRLHAATCIPSGASVTLLGTTATVTGATAEVQAGFRVDPPGGGPGAGGQFEHTRTWSFRWQIDGGWQLDSLPLCPYATSATASEVESVASAIAIGIRDRDQERLRDLADDPDRDQLRTHDQIRDRLQLLDQLALCLPAGASLEIVSLQTSVAGDTATTAARLRLQDGSNLSEVDQVWQFRRNAQNQWLIDDQVPTCPFAHAVTAVTAADDGTSVALDVGDRLIVTLEGNPTTGFTWEVDGTVPANLVQLGQPLFVADSDAIGSGGTFTFRFEAVASGSGTLRLIYHRPFETVAPEDSFEVTVTVP
jgi:inhibitor of cysteine peptidase